MRVVIVGAGFAGIDCAKQLIGQPVDVTVVDRNNYHTFQPLLYQVATAGLASSDIAYPVRAIFQNADNIHFRTGEVIGVDWSTRRLHLADGTDLEFDRLVLATGATTNYFGVDGAAEHSLPLYTLEDAIRLRNHVIRNFEDADARPELIDDGALTMVVLGGGPTGVEMAGALTELFRKVFAKDFRRRLDVGRARVVLLEMGSAVLGPFSESAQRHAAEELRDRGVELRLGERVTKVDAESVTLASGEVIRTRTVVWAAGVRASTLADRLGVEQGVNGRIEVTPHLRIPEHPEAYVVGDLAAITDSNGRLLPQVAQVAKQSGRFVGRSIARGIARSESEDPFRYFDKGSMATIGRKSAVADLPFGVRLKGAVGWVIWLILHLMYLVGFRNRLAVFVHWSWNYLTWDRSRRLLIDTRTPTTRERTGPEKP